MYYAVKIEYSEDRFLMFFTDKSEADKYIEEHKEQVNRNEVEVSIVGPFDHVDFY